MRVTPAEATDFKCHQGLNLRMGEQIPLFRGTDVGMRLLLLNRRERRRKTADGTLVTITENFRF